MYYVKLSKSTPNPSNTNQPFSNSRVTIINNQDLDQFGLLGSHQFCAFACSIMEWSGVEVDRPEKGAKDAGPATRARPQRPKDIPPRGAIAHTKGV